MVSAEITETPTLNLKGFKRFVPFYSFLFHPSKGSRFKSVHTKLPAVMNNVLSMVKSLHSTLYTVGVQAKDEFLLQS